MPDGPIIWTDSEIKVDYITTLSEMPIASFSSDGYSGTSPLTVSFTDTSTGSPTSWLWDFGDGTTSTEQNPAHTYTTNGSFTISLTVTNLVGSNTLIVSCYITVVPINSAIFGYKFNIAQVYTVLTPKPRTTWNQFDELGLLVGITRLDSESNVSIRRRIRDSFVHRANSTYQGMINGITRDLGLSLFKAISINPKIDSNSNFLAPDPYIKFDNAYVYLYSDYANNLLDYKIDRYQVGRNYEHLDNFVDFINSTYYFEASIMPNINQHTRTMCILNQTNRIHVDIDAAYPTTKYQLSNQYIVNGSLFFSDRTIYKREVATEELVLSSGDYWIDYKNGIVVSYSIPPIGVYARYDYIKFPFEPLASEIVINDLTNDNFKTKMFDQILQDNGEYCNGLPTGLGMDIILELLSVGGGFYFGK